MPRLVLACLLFGGVVEAASAPAPRNLALGARASASESFQDLTPECAIDGDRATRWSGIPGHNEGVWFELAWETPVRIAEVVVHQYDRFVTECDLVVRGTSEDAWRQLAHRGRRDERLPRVVVFRFDSLEAQSLRIANIANGPSFTEVEVHAEQLADGMLVRLAADLRGNCVGIVADGWGTAPIANAAVTLTGAGALGSWNSTARSDDFGLFCAPMPLGLQGDVSARAVFTPAGDGAAPVVAHNTVNAAALPHGLTPPSLARGVTALDGEWKFACDPPDGFWEPTFNDAAWAAVQVPAHWEMQGFHSKDGVGGYRESCTVPAGGGRLKLRFEGVYSGAEVWLNGKLVAMHEGGATPFETDITEATAGRSEAVLALRVREHTATSDHLDKMSQYADFPLAGIMRSVRLFRVPAAHVGELAVTTTFDREYRDAELAAHVAILNESPARLRGRVRVRLLGPFSGATDPRAASLPVVGAAESAPVDVGAWQRVERDIALQVNSPRPWNAEQPTRYTLLVTLCGEDGGTIDTVVQAIGFRQTEIRGAELLINGKPVKLRGTCHHDSHPLMGRAVTAELTRQDCLLIRDANLNAVRTSHYPPVPALLDAADELGLYVEDEAPFCWVGVSDDLAYTPRILQLTAELVARDRNHPSVIFWSLCNESRFGYGFERSDAWVRAADPSRPTSAATSAWLSIATLHNPLAISRIDAHEKLDKPLIFDESLCIFQGIFNDVAEMWVDPGVRDYYVEPLRAIYARFMQSRATQGSMIWCWADDIFCVPGRGLEYGRNAVRAHFLTEAYRIPGRGLTGDAPWGVVDGWRRPKPEYWITKKLHSPIKVDEAPLPIPAEGEPLRIAVENQYDFTDLSDVKIAWELGAAQGRCAASVLPRTRGVLEISPGRAPREGELLTISCVDAHGVEVGVYQLPVGAEPPHTPPFAPCAARGLELREEDALAGTSVRIIGAEFELALDKGSGLLRRCVRGDDVLLLELPTLHVLPTRSALVPLPDRLTWALDDFKVAMEGGNARIRLQGRYDRFRGTCDVTVTPAGEILVTSSFEYRGEEMRAREIGLRFSVPKNVDFLSWDRKAEWRRYPADHIGRPIGTARAFAAHEGGVPPAWPWSGDNSPLGSNDFRSTKRNVYWAGIHDAAGTGVLVAGAGRAHVRAMVESDRISVHVNDWYGGTGAGWWEWTHNYGEGRVIKKGERLESSLRLGLGTFTVAAPAAKS